MTSHFAAIILTDFLAKAQLLDRNVNLMCQFNFIMAAFINKSSEGCVTCILVYLDNITNEQMSFSL